jgi:hypothetical protein
MAITAPEPEARQAARAVDTETSLQSVAAEAGRPSSLKGRARTMKDAAICIAEGRRSPEGK